MRQIVIGTIILAFALPSLAQRRGLLHVQSCTGPVSTASSGPVRVSENM